MKKLGWKPTTIDECMTALSELLAPEEQMQLTMLAKSNLSRCHMALGGWIRNNWDLWSGGPLLDHMKSLGFVHPDDMSAAIIKEWWSRMNRLPSSLQEDIEYYADFWKKSKEQNT
jgi:hypothetical protein